MDKTLILVIAASSVVSIVMIVAFALTGVIH
jgi:hypothetical protein